MLLPMAHTTSVMLTSNLEEDTLTPTT
jgi:hypothetical protein